MLELLCQLALNDALGAHCAQITWFTLFKQVDAVHKLLSFCPLLPTTAPVLLASSGSLATSAQAVMQPCDPYVKCTVPLMCFERKRYKKYRFVQRDNEPA